MGLNCGPPPPILIDTNCVCCSDLKHKHSVSLVDFKMVERRLTRTDQAGLSQPARAGLLASASGAREMHAARETTAAGASFFTFLSHIARSQHKRHISRQTSDRSRGTSAGDRRWHVYTNNVAATTTNGADPSDTRPWGHFLAWTPCSEPQHTRWPITLA